MKLKIYFISSLQRIAHFWKYNSQNDALILSNILNQKPVQSYIPLYIANKESPCISYTNSGATN